MCLRVALMALGLRVGRLSCRRPAPARCPEQACLSAFYSEAGEVRLAEVGSAPGALVRREIGVGLGLKPIQMRRERLPSSAGQSPRRGPGHADHGSIVHSPITIHGPPAANSVPKEAANAKGR